MSNDEDRYFQEQYATMRQARRIEIDRAAREAAVEQRISERLQLDDPRLAGRIRSLGFDGNTARVFDLLPLIHVAWADGKIQQAERERIMEILRARKIGPGSEAGLFVEALLETRPTDEFMNESLAILRDVLAGRVGGASTVVDLCLAVADAAGGFLGLGGRVSDEERALLEQIASDLGDEAQAALRLRLS